MGSAKVNQKFKVVKSRGSMTMILGRDFLHKFGSTEFDWLNGRVRLMKEWLQPQVWIRSGEFHERIAVATQEVDTKEYKFDINPELTEEQKGKLLALLNEYSDCFAPNPKKPTLTSFGEHVTDTVPGSRPVKAKRFRMSPQQEEEVNRQGEQMVKDGIARPSNSPWASNVILVKKKDNTTRFVVDYRQLNDLAVEDSYPMPNIREVIDKM